MTSKSPRKPPRSSMGTSAGVPSGRPAHFDGALSERLSLKEAEVAERFFASKPAPSWPVSPLQRRMQG